VINPILTDAGTRRAFDAFVAAQPPALPWDIQPGAMWPAFEAGWAARHTLFQLPGVSGNYASVPDKSLLTLAKQAPDLTDATTAADIYQAYPRHVGKAAALKAITKAAKAGTGFSMLLDKVNHYALAVSSWPAADKKFIPHPATWFNRGSYDDDPKEWQRGYSATTSQFSKPAAK